MYSAGLCSAYVFPGHGTVVDSKGTSSLACPSFIKAFKAFFSSTVRERAFSAVFPFPSPCLKI